LQSIKILKINEVQEVINEVQEVTVVVKDFMPNMFIS